MTDMSSVENNLRQMVTGSARRTAPHMPARGSHIDIDGEVCMVTQSVEFAGRIKVYALAADGTVHETTL